ncbi:MAG: flagellar biosynthesis anti-sigma factor FlgM [Deltaproteobacteria bacterium]|nr:flagellar biosynthesis anti-sigma factor FlgM [Deltaproteobacteria bacterium]MBW2301373.1 flagellar biosynthesis anti-sigma factor FlgM [Deltaproteobacteria bacterium]
MKIDDKIISYEIGKYLSQSGPGEAGKIDAKKPTDAGGVEKGPLEDDTVVNLSQISKEAQKVGEAISSEIMVREDKVAALKEKIDMGRYTVDHEAVAEKLVNAFIEEIS